MRRTLAQSFATARAFATRAELAAAAAVRGTAPNSAPVGALFQIIETGLASMAAENAGFRIERVSTTILHVHTGRGDARFTFTANESGRGVVTFASPKVSHAGGAHDYIYSERLGHWVSTVDGHFLLELLTRDLIHNIPGGLRGIPSW
jgi:hypothetical protein